LANPFSVNVLGGFNPAQYVDKLQAENKQRADEQRELQEQRDQRLAFKNALSGKPEDMEALAQASPQMFQWMDKRQQDRMQREGAAASQIKDDTEREWLIQYQQALDSGDENIRNRLIQEAVDDPNNDLEHGSIGKDIEMDKGIVNAALYRSLGPGGYKALIAGKGAEKGTFTVKDTPSGFIRLNTATGQVSEISSDSKAAKEAKKKEKADFDRQLKQSNTDFQRSKDIRNRFDKKSSEFIKVRDAFGRIEVSATDPSPAGDLSLIFNYMKMLDPGSTVREGEFATAAGAASVPERFKGAYKKVVSGEMLTTGQRKDFVSRSKALMGKAKSQQTKDKNEAIRLGRQWGIGEQDIFGEKAVMNSSVLGREVSEQDILDTLDANPGLTREQLFSQLGINNG